MDPIMEVATKRGLFVIEDACQAHGAAYRGRRAGSVGHVGCFSFYPGKNLGAMGEAGAVVTNDRGIAEKVRTLRDHGQVKKYYHSLVGWNGRMDGIQAAVLRVKLSRLSKRNEERRRNAQRYSEQLSRLDQIQVPVEAAERYHVYHVYALRLKRRDLLKNFLAEKGIGCGIHYPVPVHLQEAYGFLGLRPGSFPVAEQCAGEFLSLPMYPELETEQIDYITNEIRCWLEN